MAGEHLSDIIFAKKRQNIYVLLIATIFDVLYLFDTNILTNEILIQ